MSDRERLLPMFYKMIEGYDDGVSGILDIGCGTLYQAFKKTYGDRYVGLDLPSTPFPKTVSGDAHDLSCFADNSFHVVTLFSVIEHLLDPYRALGEAVRVSNGFVVITTDYTQADKDRSNDHYYAWTPKTLKHLLSEFGEAKTWVERDIICGFIEK